MLVTLSGIDRLVSPHEENAPYPMLRMLDGIVTLVILVHCRKTERPMLVTLEGIVTLVRDWQLQNA